MKSVVSNRRRGRVPGSDLVVDRLGSETTNQIAGRGTGPRIWVSTVSQTHPTFEAAEHYFATHAALSDETIDRAIRERGAAVAAAGHDAVAAEATQRLAALEVRRLAEPAHRITVVAGGAMRLDDYLVTRLVEQVGHLDDLARS